MYISFFPSTKRISFDHCSNSPANQIFLKVHRIPAPSLPHATMPPDWAPARLAHSNTVNNPLPFPCYILPSLMIGNHVGALEVFCAGPLASRSFTTCKIFLSRDLIFQFMAFLFFPTLFLLCHSFKSLGKCPLSIIF